MSKIEIGGPAFPLQSIGPDFAPGHAGMSLRDYFAAKAMEAIINKAPLIFMDSREGTLPEDYAEFERAIAEGAYSYADAMIKAREGGEA